VLAQEVVPADEETATKLELTIGAKVVRIVRTRSASSEVMSLETSSYPHARFPALTEADLTNASIYHFLEEHYHIILSYAVDTIEISVAGAYEAGILKINENSPVVLVDTVGCLADNTPIVFTKTIHRGDRFRSVIRRPHYQIG
jgi:GntR family transcriptional regulator